MSDPNQNAIATIALLATVADGEASSAEKAALEAAIRGLGDASLAEISSRVHGGAVNVADVARQLTTDDARRLAYQTAEAICVADGPANEAERRFLADLRQAAGLGEQPALASPDPAAGGSIDDVILRQAMITAALELLPDRLANIAIIPMQLRMVYQIGQRHGQQLDGNQIRDLAGTLGIGLGAQMVERVVRGVFGGVARGVLGSLLGGATGVAAGAAVTFATTYALGHAAEQYYAQGRQLSRTDLQALFERFKGEAQGLFPRMEQQIQGMSRTIDLKRLLQGLGPT
jgi:uncharacterized protein (DUF697 family)